MRLSPLAQAEEALVCKLNPSGRLQFEGMEPTGPTPDTGTAKEFALNSTAWRGAIGRLLGSHRESIESQEPISFDDPKDPGALINACGLDMIALWHDPAVKRLLTKNKLRLEETSGLWVLFVFFI
jgi:guanine nucleotide-binding protein subunit alpha